LGGNAPFIVFDDADLDKAIAGAMVAKMRNGGEACTAANRFYVQRGIANAFSERLADAMAALSVGEGYSAEAQCGPMINAKAVEKIEQLVDEARGKNARVLCGGKRIDRQGHFFAPTVLLDVPEDAAIVREEIFGPVAPIYVFDTEDEAVRSANDTEYGLVSYVFSADLGRALRVSERLESGMVAINRGLVSDPAAPFGGVKQSGLGREGAHHGILDFMEAKYIATDW
jgi:succinate-semialdehyde dehydrogenase/glutarate-semialdehyde dehydrogenase